MRGTYLSPVSCQERAKYNDLFLLTKERSAVKITVLTKGALL